ncbi:Pyruvate kinase [Phytophthora cinnamomi]|uniref:Pyruvate kinase n=1 Tax=Phytophthora cinnamomi TaxID=4785 RepID=UPI00355A1625|nr:Pyruvate kinase [Phytophthora cinnamomi]
MLEAPELHTVDLLPLLESAVSPVVNVLPLLKSAKLSPAAAVGVDLAAPRGLAGAVGVAVIGRAALLPLLESTRCTVGAPGVAHAALLPQLELAELHLWNCKQSMATTRRQTPSCMLSMTGMISRANLAGKPVVTASQIHESLLKGPHPTAGHSDDLLKDFVVRCVGSMIETDSILCGATETGKKLGGMKKSDVAFHDIQEFQI